jgi:hypothetical protein
MTLPVATSRAANSVAVPCRAEDQRPLGRIEVQADHVVDLVDEVRVGGRLEGLAQPRDPMLDEPDITYLIADAARTGALSSLRYRPSPCPRL